MEVELEKLWDELNPSESLREHVEGRVEDYIEGFEKKIDYAMERYFKEKMLSIVKNITRDISVIKAFSECADTKINNHLIEHSLKE